MPHFIPLKIKNHDNNNNDEQFDRQKEKYNYSTPVAGSLQADQPLNGFTPTEMSDEIFVIHYYFYLTMGMIISVSEWIVMNTCSLLLHTIRIDQE